MFTADISKVFLDGVMRDRPELTEEPQREVNSDFPADSSPMLKHLPASEDFEPQSEVMHCDEPGVGLGDAPVVLSIQPQGVIEEKCMVKISQIADFCVPHQLGHWQSFWRSMWTT